MHSRQTQADALGLSSKEPRPTPVAHNQQPSSQPMPGNLPFDHQYSVSVFAPARLHMGFIDLGGTLGRQFGSIGVGVNEIATRLSISSADELEVAGPSSERAAKAARKIADKLRMDCRLFIRIHEAIPEHVGLGSGTQLALAVGMGMAHFHRLDLGVRDIASAIERGGRSGIGIAVFEQGGLVVDGGRGVGTVTPPLLSRMEIPPAWRFILVFDRRGQGLHGKQEVEAFKTLPIFPVAETARLCHLLMMQALPALAEGDLNGFGAVITDLQNSVGDHFAPAQGGRFASPEVGLAMAWLQRQGAVGIGQTSWGPTGFCMVENPSRAAQLSSEASQRFGGLDFQVASARNLGAEILPENASPTVDVLRA
ncbi:MAG: GHMP kinase [Proteobacteria bacterium]|nr:GHMP kinase [Pseudomonadota bacterium]